MTNSDFGHYNKKDREMAIYKIIKYLEDEKSKDKEKKDKKNLIPENFESSVISLFDYYLKKKKKTLSKSEVIKK